MKNHVRHVLEKLRFRNRAEAGAFGARHLMSSRGRPQRGCTEGSEHARLDLLHQEAERGGEPLCRRAAQPGEGHGVAVRLLHDLEARGRRVPDGGQDRALDQPVARDLVSDAARLRTRSVTPAAAGSSRDAATAAP